MKRRLLHLHSCLIGIMVAALFALVGTTVQAETVTVSLQPSTNGSFSTGASISGYYKTWTSNATSGVAGLTITTSGNLGMCQQNVSSYGGNLLAFKTTTSNTKEDIVITAPGGYTIAGYTITYHLYSGRNDSYSFFKTDGTETPATISGGTTAVATTVTESGLSAQSITVGLSDTKGLSSYYLPIKALSVTLEPINVSALNLTFTRADGGSGTATNATGDVTVNVSDGSGNAIPGVTATLASTSITELKTGSAAALSRTDNAVLAPNAGYANAQGSTITYTFQVSGLPTSFAYNAADLDVYALTGGGAAQGNDGSAVREWTMNVATGSASGSETTLVESTGNDICTVSDQDGGLYHKVWTVGTSDTEVAASDPLFVKVTLTRTASQGCYAGLGGVKLYMEEDFAPTGSEVYTINNTNPNRGAITYEPAQNTKYVWSSGKSGATAFSATNANHQWVIYPTGTADQYYLYNVGAKKFAVPTTGGSFNGVCWMFSDDAAPVSFTEQSDGTYQIFAPYGSRYMSVSNNYVGPIINYTSGNDPGQFFTINKVGEASSDVTAAVNTAVGRLVGQRTSTKLTATSGFTTAGGWYVIKVNSGDWLGHSLRCEENEITYNSKNYPVGFYGYGYEDASIANGQRLFRITRSGSGYTWQMPNGKYLYNPEQTFPVSTPDETVISIGKTSAGFSLYHQSAATYTRYATALCPSGQHFVGETSTATNIFDIYPADLTAAGLEAWQIKCDLAGENTKIACTRSDVSGLSEVYKNGYIFLPAGVTPASTDFVLAGASNVVVNATAKTVTISYDPTTAITTDQISVSQGWQTAGRDDKVYLLRVNASPFQAATSVSLAVSLKNGTENQISSLTLYEANSTSPEVLGTGSGTPTLTQVATTAIDGSSASATLSIGNFAAGDHYYWLAAQVKSDATLGSILDAAVTNITYTCSSTETILDLTSIGDPSDRGAMVFNTRSYPFLPWDNGSHIYRIPAMVVANDGSIVVACDKRYSRYDDIGNNHVIDIVIRRSTDGGKTWSTPVVVAKGDNSTAATTGYGDPSLYKDNNGKLYCLFAAGNTGYFNGLNRICMSTSTDNGVTWSSSDANPPADLVSTSKVTNHANAYGSNTAYGLYDYFVTSGRGICTSEGYLMALLPAQPYTDSGKSAHTSNSQDYIFYSTDQGATWHISENAIYTGGDEAKVTQLEDGKILASVRQAQGRGFNTATYTANGDGTLSFTMGAQSQNSQLHNGNSANNQDILYYQRSAASGKTDVIFHSMTTGSHANMKLYYSTDQGANWTEFLNVQTKGTRYVTMDRGGNDANPGSLYVFFEDQSLNATGGYTDYNHYPLNFLEITREQLLQYIPTLDDERTEAVKVADGTNTNGPDTYGDAGTGSNSDRSNATSTWTSNATSGMAGVTITSDHNAFLSTTDYPAYKCLAIIPSGTSAETYTITAPEGYLIKGYKIVAGYWTSSENYTFTASEGTGTTTGTTNATPANTSSPQIEVTGIDKASTTFTMTATGTSRFACVKEFYVYLVEDVQEPEVPVVAPTGYVTLRDDRQKRFFYADTDGYVRTSRTINHANINSASWQFVERTARSGHYDIVNKDGKYINPASVNASVSGWTNSWLQATTTQPAGYWTLAVSTVKEGAYTILSSVDNLTINATDYDDTTYPLCMYGAAGNEGAGSQIYAEEVRTLPVISDNNSSTYYTIVSERVDAYDSSVSHASLKSPDVGAEFAGVALDNTDLNQQWKFTANTTSGYNVVSAGFAQYINGDAATTSGAIMSLTDEEPSSGWTIGYNWAGIYSISNGTQQLHVGGYNDNYQVMNYGGGSNFSDIGCKLHIEAAPAPVFNLTSGWYQIKLNNNPEYYIGSDEATVVQGRSYSYTQGRVHVEKNSLRSRYVMNDEEWAFLQPQDEGENGLDGKPVSFLPLRLQSAAEKAMPANDDATYYIYVNVDGSNNVQLRSANGHWLGLSGFANYHTPMQTTAGQDSDFFTTNMLHQFDSDGYGLGTKNLNKNDAYMTAWPSVVNSTYTDLLGETHNSTENMLYMNAGTTAIGSEDFSQTRYLLRKVVPADQGLTEWTVRTGVYPAGYTEVTSSIEYSYQHETPHVTLTGVDAANVSGATTAYLGGTIFMKNSTSLTDENLQAAATTPYWNDIQRVKVVAMTADQMPNTIMMIESYVVPLYTAAKEAYDGMGIGYPKADHEDRVSLANTGVDFTVEPNYVTTAMFTGDQLLDMAYYTDRLLNEDDVTKLQMPEEGKPYTFRLYKSNNTLGYYLKSCTLGDDLTGTSNFTLAAVPESGIIPKDGWFIGKKLADGKYAFVNIAGQYVTYTSNFTQGGAYGTTGVSDTYIKDGNEGYLRIVKFPIGDSSDANNKITDRAAYGKVGLYGMVPEYTDDKPLTIYYDAAPYGSNTPLFNSTVHTTNASSAFVCEEATPFLNQDVKVNQGEDGAYYTTLYLPFPVELPDGATATIGKVDAATAMINMTEVAAEDGEDVTVLPKNTPVVIKFATQPAGGKYTFIPALTPGVSIADDANDLAGTLVNIPKVDNAYTFQKVNGKVGFYRYTGSTLKEGKAYVVFNNGGSMPGFTLNFSGNTTGINAVEVSGADGKFYDLSGRRIAQPQKGGIYIQNGRKVLVK